MIERNLKVIINERINSNVTLYSYMDLLFVQNKKDNNVKNRFKMNNYV